MLAFLKKQNPLFHWGVGAVLLFGVSWGDYITGYQLTVLVFYLLPIFYLQQWLGRKPALIMACLSGLAISVVAAYTWEEVPNLFLFAWNTLIWCSVFVLLVLLAALRRELADLLRQRTARLNVEVLERERLEKELLAIAEKERLRISHDLHDSLGQQLTATAMAGKILAKRLTAALPGEAAKAEQLVRMIEDGIELTRTLARTMHPIELEKSGLADALQNLCLSLTEAFGVTCIFEPADVNVTVPVDQAMHLYRIAQEAATNAIRHGQAKRVTIRLDGSKTILMLTVSDDGAGLPATPPEAATLGLKIMSYRAHVIGGTLDVENLPKGGVRVVCVLKF